MSSCSVSQILDEEDDKKQTNQPTNTTIYKLLFVLTPFDT